MKKVLICAPICGLKQYSINNWFEWIANQTYKEYDVAICVNGEMEERKQLLDKLNQVEICDIHGQTKNVITMEMPMDELTVIQKITYSRETLRQYAIEKDYDYIFFLDTDTIPLFRDSIEMLLSRKLDCISGLYFYKNSKQPVVIDSETNTNISLAKCEKLTANDEVCEAWGFGFGCLLLSREIFSKHAFDYDVFGEERSDDFGYCHVLEQSNITRYLYPRIVCRHLADADKIQEAGNGMMSVVKMREPETLSRYDEEQIEDKE